MCKCAFPLPQVVHSSVDEGLSAIITRASSSARAERPQMLLAGIQLEKQSENTIDVRDIPLRPAHDSGVRGLGATTDPLADGWAVSPVRGSEEPKQSRTRYAFPEKSQAILLWLHRPLLTQQHKR
ncbi:hypothetical protein LZ32DRAFT_603454 [Colletotrichum eremochloae]|nr:hypothetical protein LZ32DRAFT_603454 [Colletotrichum eremochloae]